MVGGFPTRIQPTRNEITTTLGSLSFLSSTFSSRPFNLAPLSSSMARVTHTKKSDECKRFHPRSFPSRTLFHTPRHFLSSLFVSASAFPPPKITPSFHPPLRFRRYRTRLFTRYSLPLNSSQRNFQLRRRPLFYFLLLFLFSLAPLSSLHPPLRFQFFFSLERERVALKRLRCPIFLRR